LFNAKKDEREGGNSIGMGQKKGVSDKGKKKDTSDHSRKNSFLGSSEVDTEERSRPQLGRVSFPSGAPLKNFPLKLSVPTVGGERGKPRAIE